MFPVLQSGIPCGAVARAGRLLRICFLLGACSLGAGNHPVRDLAVSEGAFFEVVGEDLRSVSFVRELGSFIAERQGGLLGLPEAYPQRVLVSLFPDGRDSAPIGWRVRVSSGGFVSLDVGWNASLQLESLCHALTAALVVRHAIFVHGPAAEETIRAWAVSALASDTYLTLRPAMRDDFRRELAGRDGMRPLADLLAARLQLSDGQEARRDAYLFFRALRKVDVGRVGVDGLVRRAIGGEDLLPVLAQGMNEEPAVWWQGTFERSFPADGSPFDSLAESRRWIEELATFGFDNVEKETELRALWNLREDPAVRSMLEARLELLRLRIPLANPAYHNAAQSLGALFEAVLDGGTHHLFLRNLARFLVDFGDARRLEEDVVNILDVGM